MWSSEGAAAQAARDAASNALTDWNAFYTDTIRPAYRFIGAFVVVMVVLYVASALSSRFFVRVDAVAWPERPRRCAQALGNALIVAAATLLPLYGMFHLFQAATVQRWWSWGVLIAAATLFTALCVWAYFTTTDWWAFWKDWWLPATTIAAIVGVTVLVTAYLLGAMNLDTPWRRLTLTYLALAALGIVIIAASVGQGCRLEVGVQNSKSDQDAPATAYLLGRLRTLGKEQTQGISASDVSSLATSLGSLGQQDLSGIPGNQVAATLMRVWSAVRPDLTWRAQITIADGNRVAMRLLRNGRLARASIFSRNDLGLSVVPEDQTAEPAAHRAWAQLLTGAAAFIITELSLVHPLLRRGLCGATEWRSVALQVIGSSVSLGEHEDANALLSQAANMDPGNAIARYEYIRRLDKQLKVPYDVDILDVYEDLRREALTDPRPRWVDAALRRRYLTGPKPRPGWESLYMSVLYRAANAALGVCATSQDDYGERLKRAAAYAVELETACRNYISQHPRLDDEVAAKARRLIPFAQIIQDTVAVVQQDRVPWMGDEVFVSPIVAYKAARLKAHALARLPREDPRREEIAQALIRELTFATGTDEAKDRARTNPDLSSVRYDDLCAGLVGMPPGFLDFEPFRPFRKKLTKVDLTTAARFAQATRTSDQRREAARHLAVPAAQIEELHEIAALGALHPALDNADMLRLLAVLGVKSPSALREQVATGARVTLFREQLTRAAGQRGLESVPAVRSPQEWLAAARSPAWPIWRRLHRR